MRLQEGRLAGAVGADDGDRLALVEREVDAEQRLEVAVEGGELARLEQRAACIRPRCPCRSRAPPARPSRARLALGDLAAEIEHDQPVDHGEQRMHDVLDPDDRDAGCAGSRGWWRPARRTRASVSPPAISSSSSSRGPVASARAISSRLRSSRVSEPAGALARVKQAESARGCRRRPAAASRSARAPAVDRADQQVLEHGELLEGLRDLVGAADAGAAARAAAARA